MSDMISASEQSQHRRDAEQYRRSHPTAPGGRPSAWTAGVEFAGIMMLVLGAIHAVQGLAALFRDDFYAVSSDGLLVGFAYTTWGWIFLGIGVLSVAAGVAIISGRTWARVVGVLFASLSLLANLAFVNAQPVWSAIVVAIDVIVIYAITVHGGELAS